jgi:NAD(P)-dependent dehydrogenase (short-subunit alcohol dehydrogenase family)
LLPSANLKSKIGPVVIFFAGGGTNSSTVGFSAYTISKIALIKMTELLDAELPQIRFVIIGPGWVETKIHNQTLSNSQSPINILEETKRRIAQGDFIQMSKVVETIFWALAAPRELIGGRNFSVADDPIASKDFQLRLQEDNNLFKLRRYGNMNFK